MNSTEFSGFELDRAVAEAEGLTIETDGIAHFVTVKGKSLFLGNQWKKCATYSPHSDGRIAYEIIMREEIDIYCVQSPKRDGIGEWASEITGTSFKGRGHTPLVAAMRCYINSKKPS